MGGGSSVSETVDWEIPASTNLLFTNSEDVDDTYSKDRAKFYKRVKRFARESLLKNLDAASVFTFLAAPGAYAAFRRFVCENTSFNQAVFTEQFSIYCLHSNILLNDTVNV